MGTTIDQYETYCEQHPDKLWPHGDCAGPGVPLTHERFASVAYDKRPFTDDMDIMLWGDRIGTMVWCELQGEQPDIIIGACKNPTVARSRAHEAINGGDDMSTPIKVHTKPFRSYYEGYAVTPSGKSVHSTMQSREAARANVKAKLRDLGYASDEIANGVDRTKH